VKAVSYLAMIKLQLEYASIVWDPIYNNDIHRLAKNSSKMCVKRLQLYNRHGSVTAMLSSTSLLACASNPI